MKKPEIYLHDFKSKQDICSNFNISELELDSAHIYLAYYHCGGWGCDSSAYVLFEKNRELFEVHGSHCSCHGLETESWDECGTQWKPELVTVEYLNHMLEKSSNDSILYFCGGYDDEVEKSVSACKEVIAYLNSDQHKAIK